MTCSVLILTKNEERNLPACLASVAWSDDVVVFDSYSSDRTVAIAQAAGVRVVQRVFDNYAAHREAARTTVQYKYPWVLAVDADERVDDELREEVLSLLGGSGEGLCKAYRVRRKDHFMGRWIKHATLYPSWFLRLYHVDSVAYEARKVHEQLRVDGKIGELRGHLLHYSFNKGFSDWMSKHVRYAELEAQENRLHLQHDAVDWSGLLAKDPVRRRRALKGLSFRLPLRPLLRFLYMYIGRRGFMDGYPGLVYCSLLAIYEYLIVLNMIEMRRRDAGAGM